MNGPLETSSSLRSQALECMLSSRHEQAISHLTQLIAIPPPDPRAFFLRGAAFAELRQFDAAEMDLRAAIALDRTLWTAHFELGLIFYMRADYSSAAKTWTALGDLPEHDSLRLFAHGLMLFATSRPEEAVQILQGAIQQEPAASELSKNMRRMLSILAPARSSGIAPAEQKPVSNTDSKHVLLNNYDALSDEDTSPDVRSKEGSN